MIFSSGVGAFLRGANSRICSKKISEIIPNHSEQAPPTKNLFKLIK